jgi:hypothetical protein
MLLTAGDWGRNSILRPVGFSGQTTSNFHIEPAMGTAKDGKNCSL